MTTHFGGVDNTSMETLTHRIWIILVRAFFIVQKFLHERECLKQVVEDRDNDHREAIHELEQRLNRLTLTLHHSDDPIENMLDKYTETLCTTQKKTIFGEFFVTRYPHIEWARLFTA